MTESKYLGKKLRELCDGFKHYNRDCHYDEDVTRSELSLEERLEELCVELGVDYVEAN